MVAYNESNCKMSQTVKIPGHCSLTSQKYLSMLAEINNNQIKRTKNNKLTTPPNGNKKHQTQNGKLANYIKITTMKFHLKKL